MKSITVKYLGPIHSADINFEDLTLFIGPHASGKSILLQMIKLMIDKDHIQNTTEQYGFVWGNNVDAVIDRYFGEGMSGIIQSDTTLGKHLEDKPYER